MIENSSLFDHTDYREFTLNRLGARSKKGYGQLRRMAEYLGVHSTFVSQVFKGQKLLSPEQGILVAEFLGLSHLETQYFIKLIQLSRAGNEKLRKLIMVEIESLKSQAQKISVRLASAKFLPDDQKAIFYSDWYYSGIRLLVGIDGHQDIETIANKLNLPPNTVANTLEFLKRSGLLVHEGDRLKVGPQKTHLDADSPYVKSHHTNWRLKALTQMPTANPNKIHYSSPMTVGRKDVEVIREKLLTLIEEIGRVVDPSPNEELMCLNIDWFRVL